MKPIGINAYRLFHDGALTLQKCEERGIRVDMDYCESTKRKIEKKIVKINERILTSKEGKKWKKKYGTSFKLGSAEQLTDILCNEMGVKPTKFTKVAGRPSMDKDALEDIQLPLVQNILNIRKLEKISGTFLQNIMIETVDGIMRPSFNLNTVTSYRSSCSGPNFQNVPIRDPIMGKIIRTAVIPREGRRLVEFDYKALEVAIACCYHKDPTMIDFLVRGIDFHLNFARKCFLLPKNEIHPDVRFIAKGDFVFPEFYGSFFELIAPSMWQAMDKMKLVTNSGVPIKEHLRNKGIYNLSEFTDHIKEVEKEFWNTFNVYEKWRRYWYAEYRKKGYFDTLTGFRCQGYMARNEVINIPVQGSAFHCLLQSLIDIEKALKNTKLESFPIGQIHDSIVCDVVEEEMDEFINFCIEISTKRLMEKWRWINVPLNIDVKASEVNGNWYKMDKVII